MLKYVEASLSYKEIPKEVSLVVYISGCTQKCKSCHTPWLQKYEYGSNLIENYKDLVDLYFSYITCVCFLGEGLNTKIEHQEYIEICKYIHSKGLKVGLYCGRDTNIEKWMYCFDYVKIGAYQESRGSLYNKNTNQKLYKKENNKYKDITKLFWNSNCKF